jgi:hypothetical protein
MNHRHVFSVVGAALLSAVTVVLGQTSDQTAPETTRQAGADETPITLVGCVQRESDYRKQQDTGRGGVASTGLGLRNEYVLINASRTGSTGTSVVDCSSASGGEAYEVTGKAERDLEPFVGKMVEINGMLKKADIDDDAPVGTSGNTRPSGGFDPLGQDLRLFEVNVMSFREMSAQASAQSVQAPAAPAPEQRETEPVGTAGSAQQPSEREELPGTASPLPLAGLFGLLSLAGALGVRRLR